nr:FHA domain-containing protein [Anaerolineae bacterium]
MQSSDNFRLIVRRGPQPNQVYDLNKDIITIGRDITNDITINDPEVSRHHLRFTRGAGGFTLEDLGSTNGTFVNGQRLTGAKPLNNGDMLGLGETVTLGYEMARGAAPVGQAPVVGGQP